MQPSTDALLFFAGYFLFLYTDKDAQQYTSESNILQVQHVIDLYINKSITVVYNTMNIILKNGHPGKVRVIINTDYCLIRNI